MGSRTSRGDETHERGAAVRRLVECLGPHPWGVLGEPLHEDQDLGRWLVLSCLLSGARDEQRALDAFRALADADLESPSALAAAAPAAAAPLLEAAGLANPERTAHQLYRAGQALALRHRGSLDALAGESEGLEELGGRLASLGPGIGAATVARFLAPLRERWAAAAELPLTPAAHAAAVHLGWVAEGDDLEAAPAALRRALGDLPGAPSFIDVESALERLGRRACLRGRAARCPMREHCPLGDTDSGPG